MQNVKPTNMPISPSAKIKHKIAFRQCRDFGPEETVRLISTHNPWRGRAYNLFEQVLRVTPVTTVGQILKDASAIGYYECDVMRHLRWLYTWGDFLEINGNQYFPEVEETRVVKQRKRVK